MPVALVPPFFRDCATTVNCAESLSYEQVCLSSRRVVRTNLDAQSKNGILVSRRIGARNRRPSEIQQQDHTSSLNLKSPVRF